MIWFKKKKKLIILSDLNGNPANITNLEHEKIVNSVLSNAKNISTNGVDIRIKYI